MADLYTCKICGSDVPTEEFDWRQKKCKPCQSYYMKEYRRANRERLLIFDKERYAANPEFKRSLAKKWAAENRERHSQNTRSWYLANKEKARASEKKWEQNNKSTCRAKAHRRRARLESVGGLYLPASWDILKEACEYKCLKCGRYEPEIKLTVDHVIPIVLGGPNTIDNLQPLCHSCNSGKGARTKDYRNAKIKAASEFLRKLECALIGSYLQTSNITSSSRSSKAV